MTKVVPTWMDAEFLQGVLRRNKQDDTIEVTNIHSKSGTDKGDNYTSDLYRILVEFTRKKADMTIADKMSIFVKLAPEESGNKRTIIEETGVFEVEANFMSDTVKKMNKLVGNNHRFSATLYHVKKEYPSFLIFEDLAPLGFRMAQRRSGLDLEHGLLAIKNLAKFHASSAVVCEREPSQKSLYWKGMFCEAYPKEEQTFFVNGIEALADEVEGWPELGSKYAKKLKELSKTIYAKGLECTKRRDDEFNVINHGDCWVNNMLFRYDDEGKPIDHIFVDFQVAIYTSPAMDLHYFLSTSLAPKVYDESRQMLLEEYMCTLTSCLKEYGYKKAIPTMAEIQRYLEEREFYAVISSFEVLPIILVEKEKAVDLNEMLLDDGGYNNPALKGEAFRKVMIKRIPYFDKRGLLDN